MELAGYKIEAELHRGEKNIVYLATRLMDLQKVTLKTFLRDPLTELESLKLKQEFEISEYLSDLPGVVRTIQLETFRNTPVIVAEYLEGQSLKDHLLFHTLDLKEFLKLSISLAQTIGEIHDRNVIHKDIKPSNILLSKDMGIVKITDFGVSSRLKQEQAMPLRLDSFEGTMSYISPEQTGRMNRVIDYRSDLYSLGITMYESVTGRLPFESGDPLELLHSHIARKPDPPEEIDVSIPHVISRIILKLLEKDPNDRYQSAYGLKKDLEICLQNLYDNKLDSQFDFLLGEFDFSGRIQKLEHVYGRSKELDLLQEHIQNISEKQKKELILITGNPGMGKSSLLKELLFHKVHASAIFAFGRFEEFKKDTPYTGFATAIQEFCKYVISLEGIEIEIWKKVILDHVGNNGKVLLEVFPELEWVIGELPDVPPLEPFEAYNRFNTTFQNLIKAIASSEKPVVFILDDLHWTDDSSLYMLFQIMADSELSNLIIIATCRQQEFQGFESLVNTIELIKRGNIPVLEIDLEPIQLGDTELLISKSLSIEVLKIVELAEIIHRKTEGNPFFIHEFLRTIYEEKILYFDYREKTWVWNLSKVKSHNLSESVVEIVTAKLNRLPKETIELLTLASCYGNQFEITELSRLTSREIVETLKVLWQPIEEGIIEPLDSNYKLLRLFAGLEKTTAFFKFQHERIRAVAYNRYTPTEKEGIHLQIARLTYSQTPLYKIDERIFEIVNHYNIAISLVQDEFEKIRLLELNIVAGKKALSTNSYQLAVRYFQFGTRCLPHSPWSTNPEITMELMKCRAESEFYSGNYETSIQLIEEILTYSTNLLDKMDANALLLTQFNITGQYSQALQTGRNALRLFNIELPDSDHKEKVKVQLDEIKDNLRNQKIASLISMKPMEDREMLVIMKVLARVKSTAYLTDMNLYPWLVTKMVNLSLKHGNSPESCFAYATYGIILGNILEDYNSSYEFGWLGYKLSEKINNKGQRCKSGYILANYINPWREHLKNSIKINEDCYRSGIESGEMQFAGYALTFKLLNFFNLGFKAQDVLFEIKNSINFTTKTQNNWALDMLHALLLVSSNLNRVDITSFEFKTEGLTEAKFIQQCNANSSKSAICLFYIFKAMVLYLYEAYDEAFKYIHLAKSDISSILGQYEISLLVFFHSLILCEIYSTSDINKQVKYLEELKDNQSKLELWAKHCPKNFAVMHMIVDIELQRISNLNENLMDSYENAIDKAKEYENPVLEAISNELAFRYALHKANKKLARLYLDEALQCYKALGYKGKIARIEDKYPDYLIYSQSGKVASKLENTTSRITGSVNLDLYTVIKASQAIASEMKIERLVEKVLEVVIEMTGAERGVLVLYNDTKRAYSIEGEISIPQKFKKFLQSIPLTDARDIIPEKVLRYTLKTKTQLILENAFDDPNFKSDIYILKHNVRSVLCIPLLYRGILKGCLYLENNLTNKVFTPDRLSIIELILGQAVVSLHNTLVYEKLEDLVEERTAKLKTSLEQVRQLKIQQDRDYFLLGELLAPFKVVSNSSTKFKVETHIRQQKDFEFKKYRGDIGGDLINLQELYIGNKKYIIFVNGDAMGKSSQGAGGLLVFSSVYEGIMFRTRNQEPNPNLQIISWLTKTYWELNQVFSRFKGTMLFSLVLAAIEEESGELFFINADHPRPIIFRDNKASFLGRPFSMNKLGLRDEIENVRVGKFLLEKGDILICGSDGKDNLGIGIDEDGQQIVNFDDNLFKITVELSNGNLQTILDKIRMDGEIIDDLSLIRIEHL